MSVSGISANVPGAGFRGQAANSSGARTENNQNDTRREQVRREQRRQQRRAEQREQQADRKLPRAFRENLEFGVVEPTGEMFKKVVDTQSNETVKVMPPVFMLKHSVNMKELVGRFLDQKV